MCNKIVDNGSDINSDAVLLQTRAQCKSSSSVCCGSIAVWCGEGVVEGDACKSGDRQVFPALS